MTNLFNPAAFFILFRESIEAVIILCVLLRFVDESIEDSSKKDFFRKQVWWGVSIGLALSFSIGIAFIIVFYVLGKDVFGEAEALWEGILQLLACIFLTWLAFKMLNMTNLTKKWQNKLSAASKVDSLQPVDTKSFKYAYAYAILAFTVVIREGLEAVVFIAGVGSSDPISLIIPSILGLILGLAFGYLLYRFGSKISLNWFFKIACGLILLIAAGMAAGFAHEFEEYHYERLGYEDIESTPILWDASECCSEKTNGFFQILKGLVGWRSVGTVATVTCYFTYWAVVLIIFLIRRSTDRKRNLTKKEESSSSEA